ncbi:alpha/beta fold hydrolase [Pseudomonas sp. A3.4]|nr:alpha/beta hydrolase [Atopomonas sediminilitoris]MCJ8167975.1 alpha/beta fold hydrolase [Atopomonas sediminilitoris]
MVDLGEVRLAYQVIGAEHQPPLLLVMGLGGQLIDWPDSVVTALCQQGFRVIRFDNRGVGLSVWQRSAASPSLAWQAVRYRLGLPVEAPYVLADLADDALALLDALQIERAHVLGASLGGMVAQHMAAKAPQRLLSLTLLMSTSGDPGLPPPNEHVLTLLTQRSGDSLEARIDQQVALLAALGNPAWPSDMQALKDEAAASFARSWRPEGVELQLLALLAEPARNDLLQGLQVPTLVVHGTADPLLPVMHGVHLAAQVPGAKLQLIAGLAHRFQPAFAQPLLAAVVPHLQANPVPAVSTATVLAALPQGLRRRGWPAL